MCVITSDKVRLYSTEGVRRYLANHHITDIEPESISFSPYKWETDCDQTSSSREMSGGSVEDTTSRSKEEGSGSGSRTAVIVLSVLGVTLLLCCLVFLLYRSEKREALNNNNV